MTLQQIADEMGISVQRVHQLYHSGMEKLRANIAADPNKEKALRSLLEHELPEEPGPLEELLEWIEKLEREQRWAFDYEEDSDYDYDDYDYEYEDDLDCWYEDEDFYENV